MPSAADPSINNTDKEVAPNATPPSSLLSNYALESSNNEQVMLSTAVHLRQRRLAQGVSSPVGLWIASELRNQEICRSSRFRNASIKSLDLRRQRHGNLDQSRDWNQITIAIQFVHHGYRMHRY